MQGSRSAHRTLRAWQKDVQVKANYWEKCRLQRVSEYEDLQVGSSSMLGQVQLATPAGYSDMLLTLMHSE